MIPIDTILLDLDGVIRDWDGAIFDKFDMPYVETFTYPKIRCMVIKEHGISNSYFWELQDREFWVNIGIYKWAYELTSLLPYDKVYIMTAPTKNNAGWSQEWIRKNMPEFFKDKKYLIGPAKHLCANPTSLLIDDYDININKFQECGCNTITFPQTWNRFKHLTKDRILYIKQQLELYKF